MNTPFDRNRSAPSAPGRSSAARAEPAPGDFAAKQPVAFTPAALRETGETPAEAARRLGMIDPAFLRASREAPHAGALDYADAAREVPLEAPLEAPLDALVARREPSGVAPAPRAPQQGFGPQPGGYADAGLTARRAPEPAATGYAPVAPAARPAAYDAAPEAYVAEAYPPETYPDDADPRASGAPSAAERMNASLGGAAAGVKAFIAAWRARRAQKRAVMAERAAEASPAGAEAARPHKLTAREKRWRRRRSRLVFEEALGWVLVPVIVVGLYYATIGGLALFGMTIDDLVAGLNVAWTQLR